MKSTGKIAILAVFSFAGAALCANGISLQPQAGVTFKAADDFSFGMTGSMHTGPRLDQTDNLIIPGQLNKVQVPFAQKGYNGWTAAPWLEIKLAKIGAIDLSGGGEITVLSRKADKDQPIIVIKKVLNTVTYKYDLVYDSLNSQDYFEIRPAGFLLLSIPMGKYSNFSFSNKLERRLFRSPIIGGLSISYFRYVADLSLSAVPFTSQKITPYVLYNGFTQKYSKHLSAAGAGVAFSPAGGITLDIAYRVLWVSSGVNSSEQQVGINATYEFDFTK
jgi:hypothetical protein